MLNLPAAFLGIANRVSAAFGAPFYDAFIVTQTDAVIDEGGSIVTSGGVDKARCRVQIDAQDQALRPQGWVETDYAFIILAASIMPGDASGIVPAVNTDIEVQIPTGPRAGMWTVSSLSMDPAAIGYAGKGRQSA